MVKTALSQTLQPSGVSKVTSFAMWPSSVSKGWARRKGIPLPLCQKLNPAMSKPKPEIVTAVGLRRSGGPTTIGFRPRQLVPTTIADPAYPGPEPPPRSPSPHPESIAAQAAYAEALLSGSSGPNCFQALGSSPGLMMIILLLFLQKQNLASAHHDPTGALVTPLLLGRTRWSTKSPTC